MTAGALASWMHGLAPTTRSTAADRGFGGSACMIVLGHSSSGVTTRYIDHLGDDAAIDAVAEAFAAAMWHDGWMRAGGTVASSTSTTPKENSGTSGVPSALVAW